MPYLTGSSIPTADFICRRLRIPNDIDLIISVNGALDELTNPENWEQFGTATPEEAAAAMDSMFREYLLGDACMLGAIVLYSTTAFPTGILACDGASHLRTTYPRLYSVLPGVYITDADNFTVPALYQGTDMKYGIVAQ